MIQTKIKRIINHNLSEFTDLNSHFSSNNHLVYNNKHKNISNPIKKNLPELKLTKLKQLVPIKMNKVRKEDQKIKHNLSHNQSKKKDIVLPQIKSKKKLNEMKLDQNNNSNITNLNMFKPSMPKNSKQKTKCQNEKEKEIDIEKDNIDYITEKLNLLNSLYSSLSSLTGGTGIESSFPSLNYSKSKKVDITPDLLTQYFRKFEPSITSKLYEFSKNDYIKAYSYNSHQGNVRDYNEDTIAVTKIDSFYFFGIYDGHGGKGCSLFLKENLHLFIKEFSIEGIHQAIITAEDTFIKTRAMTKDELLGDPSGSCGIIAVIQGNQCIIANVGDSRCIVYEKNKVDFYTEDHKPGTTKEKERIEKAGGNIYQTASLFCVYQNGEVVNGPWRVFPGRLSVSRTFGDVEAKVEKFGGMKDVVVASPDLTQITLTSEHNYIVLGCDGIFDVLSNEEIMDCINIALKAKNIYDINEICGEASNMIIKAALAKDSFDNVSCIVIALNMNS